MQEMPTWWRPDAPHWSGRTTAIIALLAFLAATVVGVIALSRSPASPSASPASTSSLRTSPPAQPDSTSTELCSDDSEGDVADGWGPDRPTYHDDTFPTALTFNSTSDSVIDGDERNLTAVKPTSEANGGGWSDSVEVHNNQEYLVRIFVRLDGPEAYEAKKTKLVVSLPTCTGHRVGLTAILSSLDAFPSEVWDGASFWSRSDFNLALVPDSGVLYGNAWPRTAKGELGLPYPVGDLVTSKGIPLGSERLDGVFKPGYKHAVYIQFKVRAQVAE